MSADEVVMSQDPAITEAAKRIQDKIHGLRSLDDENLKGAMDDLKRALMQNPAACALMLPEDVGSMVEALRRITGEAAITTKASKKAKKEETGRILTAEEVEQLEDF